MPIDYAYTGEEKIQLRKRIWADGSNDWWLIVGARIAELNTLPTGDIIFDPTLELQPDATDGIDNYVAGGSPASNYGTGTSLGIGHLTGNPLDWTDRHGLIKFNLSSLSGTTISSATFYYYNATASWQDRGTGYTARYLACQLFLDRIRFEMEQHRWVNRLGRRRTR